MAVSHHSDGAASAKLWLLVSTNASSTLAFNALMNSNRSWLSLSTVSLA